MAKDTIAGFFVSIGTDGSGDKSEMCAVNSSFFLKENRDKKCSDFILNMDLSIPDALSLNLSKKNIKLAFDIKCLTWVLVVLTLALLWIGIAQKEMGSKRKWGQVYV